MVEHETTGFLTPPEQPKALADALLILIRNSELRLTMRKASLESFLTKSHVSLMAERVEQVYSDALAH